MVKTVESPKTGPDEIDQKDVELWKYWNTQMCDALSREKKWRKEARDVIDIYEGVKKTSFNILYSNTETLMPALYSATPKPAVQRRLRTQPSPVAQAAAEILNRAISQCLDTNDEGESEFDAVMQDCVLTALVPDRGQAWFNYEAKFEEVDEDDLEELKERDDPRSDPDETKKIERVKDEYVCFESVPWDQFLHGYARKWSDVPWVARVYIYTKTEMDAKWPKICNLITYEAESDVLEEDRRHLDTEKPDERGRPQVTTVYQIWDKTTKKVYHICTGYKFGPLEDPLDDPLRLSGFFPCPEPLSLTRKLNKLTPRTLYTYYKAQAEELEEITCRLKSLIKAMKIRGMYSGLVDDIAKVLEAEENEMIPITNTAALSDKALNAAVMFVPIQDYVPVIQELWAQRQQIKQVIYEVTGISDILRGATVANETATAQDIKNRWGTLRLQDMQKRVQKFSRECLRIVAEIMANHYAPEKFAQITGMNLLTAPEKQQLQMMMQQMQQQQAMMQQMGQPQPPQPPLPPEQMELLQKPTWEEVEQFLQNKLMREYRLDIETDSTLADDVKQDKQELNEIMTGITQLIQALTPAVQGGFMSFETAKGFLKGFVSRFRIGAEVEELLDKAVEPPPKEDPGAEQERQAKQEEMKIKLESERLKNQRETMEFEHEKQIKEMEMVMAREKHQMEMAKLQATHAIDMQELHMKNQQMQLQTQAKVQQTESQMALNSQQAAIGFEQNEQQLQMSRENNQLQREGMHDKANFQRETLKQKKAAQKAAANKPKQGDK